MATSFDIPNSLKLKTISWILRYFHYYNLFEWLYTKFSSISLILNPRIDYPQ